MKTNGLRCGFIAAFLCCIPTAALHAGIHKKWIVRGQSVRADEEFLASDAMRGRGSATHDEEVTATYVASEFIAHGLKPAPGMSGYIQRAEIISPELDGHSTLQAGSLHLAEGQQFQLLTSSGFSVTGPLLHVHAPALAGMKLPVGAVVLIDSVPDSNAAFKAISVARRAGASAILFQGGGPLSSLYALLGGKTRTPMRLAGEPISGSSFNAVLLQPSVLSAFASLNDGDPVTITVHTLPVQPRYTYNAVGYLPGTNPSAGTILLTAHLDHLGIGDAVNGDSIYNGANDDAAGTTAVLELAHALGAGHKLKRSILFVCYGSEEIGEKGSTWFGEHPPVPLKQIVANLEFEMIGNQDPKMPKGTLLLTGWDRSNLGPTLKAHGALLGPDPYPEQNFFGRSDNYALALKGVVAHTAAGWGTPPTYHQPNDDLAHLDFAFMTAAIQSLVEPVRWLASSNFVPQWNPGGQPKKQ